MDPRKSNVATEGAAAFFGLLQQPSRAFGDGSHPTTQLCARAVDFLCRTRKPRAVLDVGTGTGILARLARRHGASFVVGTDIDEEALIAARANVALDGDSAIEICDRAPDAWGPRFDLVVANILQRALCDLAPALMRACAPGAVLVLSGFQPAQVPEMRRVFGGGVESRMGEWSLLMRT
jgi:ribosomal protein L11 methyltransferase